MTRKILVFVAFSLALSLSRAATLSPALELFVDARMGNDLGSCRASGNSCRTIQAAIDRIPAVLTQDVIVHIASGTYLESLLLADRLAPQGHSIRLVGEPQATLKPAIPRRGDGLAIRRSPLVVLENLTIQGFANGVHVRLSDLVVNNSRIAWNAGSGIMSEKGWVTLQASTAGSGLMVQDNSGSGILATCGSHVEFVGPSWIGGNGTGLTATFGAVIDLNGRPDVTLIPVAPFSPPPDDPHRRVQALDPLPNESPMSLAGVEAASVPPCGMVADHQGMIMGYANAQIAGLCACYANDLSLCHPGTE